MTSNVPAVPDRPAREIATVDTDSWVSIVGQVAKLADHISGTEFVPKALRGSAPAVAAAILYGREVGLPPMTSLTQTHVIEGRPSMSAEAMRALVLAQGHAIEFLEATGAICRMRARRAGSDTWTELAWTIDMARAAGLLGKSNWKGYPRAMLVARCTADLCRMVFPDVIHGFRSIEEMDDLGEPDFDAPEPVAGPTTKVARKRTPAKKAAPASAPAPLEAGQRPERMAGPPLPGEDGYDAPVATAPEPVEEVAPDDGTAEQSAASGEDTRQATSSASSDEPEDIVDGETVEEEPAANEDPPATGGRPASAAQIRMVMGSFGRIGLTDDESRENRLQITSELAGRVVGSSKDLTSVEASRVIDTLARVKDLAGLVELLEKGVIEEPPAES